MTEQTITPPPHLLKQFSEQAKVESNKRGGSGYLKTFARFCIEWAMGQLNAKPTPNSSQIRSSDITPPPELRQLWAQQAQRMSPRDPVEWMQHVSEKAAQYGADQQLAKDAEWLDHNALNEPYLRITPMGESLKEAMRPKPPSLKEQALEGLTRVEVDLVSTGEFFSDQMKDLHTIRRALEALPND